MSCAFWSSIKSPIPRTNTPHGKEAVDGVHVAELLGQDVKQVFKNPGRARKSAAFMCLSSRWPRS